MTDENKKDGGNQGSTEREPLLLCYFKRSSRHYRTPVQYIHCFLTLLSMDVCDYGDDQCRQRASKKQQDGQAERLVEPGPCDSIVFPLALFAQKLGQHLALLDCFDAMQSTFGGVVSLLGSAQLEAELRHQEMGRETVFVESRSRFKLIDRGIDVVRQCLRHSQEHVTISEIRRVLNAAGKCRNRLRGFSRLKMGDPFLERLPGLHGKRGRWAGLQGIRKFYQFVLY